VTRLARGALPVPFRRRAPRGLLDDDGLAAPATSSRAAVAIVQRFRFSIEDEKSTGIISRPASRSMRSDAGIVDEDRPDPAL